MSIHHLLFVSVCLFWAYLLVCLALKLALDVYQRRHLRQATHQVDLFFAPGQSFQQRETAFPKIRRLCADRRVLRHVCDSYADLPESFPEHEKADLMLWVQQLLRLRIKSLHRDDHLSRAALAWEIRRCALPSESLQEFARETAVK